jgi:hypothetical protein
VYDEYANISGVKAGAVVGSADKYDPLRSDGRVSFCIDYGVSLRLSAPPEFCIYVEEAAGKGGRDEERIEK